MFKLQVVPGAPLWFFVLLFITCRIVVEAFVPQSFVTTTSRISRTRIYGQERDNESAEVKQYFATCIPGLAPILSEELINLGAQNVEQSGTSGVSFQNDPNSNIDIGMKSLLWVRTAHRIMELVVSTEDYDNWDIFDRDSLYGFIQSTAPIRSLLGDGKGGLLTLSCSTVLNGAVPKELCHSHYTGLTVKNALVDMVREVREDGLRPDVDIVDPDVPLVLVLRGNRNSGGAQATLYRVLHSGGSLHRRGYRVPTVHKAAMKESMAAGLLLESGYDKLIKAAKSDELPAVLVDPMAGSGTFCVEAALIAADFAPGLMRMKHYDGESDRNPHQVPPIVRWKGTDKAQWKEMILDARDRASAGMKWMRQPNVHDSKQSNCVIMGNELNERAAALARGNISKAGFADHISIHQGDCCDWDLNIEETNQSAIVPGRSIIVSNPPWGLRLDEDIESSWLSLKSFFRDQCNESEAWVLSGNKATTRFLRMKKSRSVVVKTADEDLRWIQYHIFKKKPSTAEVN